MESYKLNSIPPSKKNSKRIVFNKKTGRPFILSSKAYEKWHSISFNELSIQKKSENQICKCDKMEITFYVKNKRLFDLSNKAESVLDLLVDVGILTDDNYFVIPKLELNYVGSYSGEIVEKDKTVIVIS